MRRFIPLFGLLALAACGSGSDRPAAEGLAVSGAWVRATPPGSTMTGAYMTLHNHGPGPVRLRRVSSPAAEVVEIHDMIMEDGRMAMVPRDRLEIGPGTSVELAPGGLHLMLIGLTGPLEEGRSIPIELHPDGASEVSVEAPVRRQPPGASGEEAGDAS